MRYLVDTDVLIDHLRGSSLFEGLLEQIERKEVFGYISTVTEVELFAGERMEIKAEREKVIDLLKIFHPVAVDSFIAQHAGEIKRKYSCSFPDAIIAATALRLKAKLVTRNIKHFENIKEVEVLTK